MFKLTVRLLILVMAAALGTLFYFRAQLLNNIMGNPIPALSQEAPTQDKKATRTSSETSQNSLQHQQNGGGIGKIGGVGDVGNPKTRPAGLIRSRPH